MIQRKKSLIQSNQRCANPWVLWLSLTILIAAQFLLMITAAQSQTRLEFQGMWPETNGTQCLNTPKDVTVDDKGNLYVLDSGNYRVRKFSAEGQFLDTWGTLGSGDGQFIDPISIAYHPDGFIYVSDSGWSDAINDEVNRVQKFTLNGDFAGKINGWETTDDNILRFPQGIAINQSGDLFVTIVERVYNPDQDRYEYASWIYRFNSDNHLIKKWKLSAVEGWHEAQIIDIAIEPDGNLIALINTHQNQYSPHYPDNEKAYPLYHFTPDGDRINRWEISPPSNEECIDNAECSEMLDGGLSSICVDSQNRIYISHLSGYWIKQYSKNGEELASFGGYGTQGGQLNQVHGITLDKEGNLLVADSDNQRVQKLTTEGDFISSIQCSGTENGLFMSPQKISIGPDQRVYVADSVNERIQFFETNGKFIDEIETGHIVSMAVDYDGNIYTAQEWGNAYIQKFNTDGELIDLFWNDAEGEPFGNVVDIAFSPSHHLYIADEEAHTIYRMTTDGNIVGQWGNEGFGNGAFVTIQGLDVGKNGDVYVVDSGYHIPEIKNCPEAKYDPSQDCGREIARVQRFDSAGNWLSAWGDYGDNKGEFINPNDVAIDADGNVWVVDTGNHRLQQFSHDGTFLNQFGEIGDAPGMFSGIHGATFDSGGRLYTTETGNSRVQVFSIIEDDSEDTIKEARAIIVAGGGPYQGNTLWNATQLCANMAYRTLLYQGYTRDRIHFLSWDTNLDLDGNSQLDDVDAIPSNDALKIALESWTIGAGNLLVYMVDHGGDGQFRMGEQEVMSAEQFSQWFQTATRIVLGKSILIYDACRSGSFIPAVASTSAENPPIVITSSGPDESAYFTNNGTLSFSYQFWSQIQNGMTLRNAFFSTQNAIQFAYGNQLPLMDDNGNGIANEDNDGEASKGIFIGKGIISAGDLPVIDQASVEPSTLNGEPSATVQVNSVTDADGIERVWAVITPSDFLTGSPETPIIDLPTITLTQSDVGGYWEGTYSRFTATGLYKIALYAEDRRGEISLPTALELIQKGGDPSANISQDLFTIKIPCLEIGDGWLSPSFKMVTPNNSSGMPLAGFFYALDYQNLDGLSSCPSESATLLSNVDIDISRIVYEGMAFSITMRYRQDLSNDTQWIWELDLATAAVLQ